MALLKFKLNFILGRNHLINIKSSKNEYRLNCNSPSYLGTIQAVFIFSVFGFNTNHRPHHAATPFKLKFIIK